VDIYFGQNGDFYFGRGLESRSRLWGLWGWLARTGEAVLRVERALHVVHRLGSARASAPPRRGGPLQGRQLARAEQAARGTGRAEEGVAGEEGRHLSEVAHGAVGAGAMHQRRRACRVAVERGARVCDRLAQRPAALARCGGAPVGAEEVWRRWVCGGVVDRRRLVLFELGADTLVAPLVQLQRLVPLTNGKCP
jgi:hypothetical protein